MKPSNLQLLLYATDVEKVIERQQALKSIPLKSRALVISVGCEAMELQIKVALSRELSVLQYQSLPIQVFAI